MHALKGSIPLVVGDLVHKLAREADMVDVGEWHAMDVRGKPELVSHELRNVMFESPMPRSAASMAEVIKPNLPWAEEHFQERISGQPLNPPPSHERWPWATANPQHMKEGRFSHSYPERFWPKHAGYSDSRTQDGSHRGIRYRYGDLEDLIDTLYNSPLTRQAYLPIWFPEDLGAIANGERVPCTLGYHFMVRNRQLHMVYYIRSCDWFRYFRDDLYMACRLALAILTMLRTRADASGSRDLSASWTGTALGTVTMVIHSLHYFEADVPRIMKEAGLDD